MRKLLKKTNQKQPRNFKKTSPAAPGEALHLLAFENSFQANIITNSGSGKIIIANNAACKLLGYSKDELLTKSRSTIFDINESSFKKMLRQRTEEGHSKALATAIQKNGATIPCEITSAIFMDENGIENAITTISDLRQSILRQKNIDTRKKKLVTENIVLALEKSDARLVENNQWLKYIAKASYDVMWDWNIVTGEIYVGDSIKEVFGYKLRNNTASFRDFGLCLLPEERSAVEKKLLKTLASRNKTWNDSYMFKRADGTQAATISRASVVRNEKGKAVRLIGAIQDVSRLLDLEKRLEEQISVQEEAGEIYTVAARLSFDVIWDWNLFTNEGSIGEGFEEMFGYRVINPKGNISDWDPYLHPDDKKTVKKGLRAAIASMATRWEQSYRFMKADGTIAKVFNRATIIRQPDGKACRMIGALQDMSKQKVLEERLEQEIATKGKMLTEFKESFKLIFNSTSDILYDVDMIANEIIISDAFEKEFGYKITGKMTLEKDWVTHIHPGDREAVTKDYARMLFSVEMEWKLEYRFLRADGSVANVSNKGIVLRNTEGKAYRMIGSIHDISEQKVLEDRLAREIKLKEKQIAEAAEDAKYTERSDLGKELHDNINQLLGASRLYLELAKRGGEQSEMYLSRSSEYTLNAIEEIRKLTKGMTTDIVKNLGLCEAIENLVQDVMEVNPVKIVFGLDSFIENRVNDKFKLNVFRIVQEQLNNVMKHAQATELSISLAQNKKFIILSITDNGVGFDINRKRKGIGVDNIISRAASYGGTADFNSQPGKGCILTVKFIVSASLLKQK